jgi:RNA polymerase sigma factor (sigma-70 family)
MEPNFPEVCKELLEARGDRQQLTKAKWKLAQKVTEYANRAGEYLRIDPCPIVDRIDSRLQVIEVHGVWTLADVTQVGCTERRKDILAFALRRRSPELALAAYIGWQIRSVANDEARHVENARRVSLEGLYFSETGELFQSADQLEQVQRLWEAVAELPPCERDAIISYHRVGGTQLEVAHRLGITRDRLQTMLLKGYKSLRDSLRASADQQTEIKGGKTTDR